MDMEIIPCKSIGPIKLGMTPEEVQQALGSGGYRILETYDQGHDGLEEHFFEDLMIGVQYYRPGRLAFVEVSETLNPLLLHRPLLLTPFSTLAEWFKDMDPETEIDTDGLKSQSLGIAISAPGHQDEPERYAQSVILFEKDYWETAFSNSEAKYLADYEAAMKKYGPDDPKTRDFALDLSANYEVWGKKAEEAKWHKIWLEGE